MPTSVKQAVLGPAHQRSQTMRQTQPEKTSSETTTESKTKNDASLRVVLLLMTFGSRMGDEGPAAGRLADERFTDPSERVRFGHLREAQLIHFGR